MSGSTVALALLLGFLAGTLAGLRRGRRDPVRPDPGLARPGSARAGATSLLAIVPTAAVAAYRQRGRGTLNVRAALVIGISSFVGVEAGVQIATRLDETLLRRLFGLLLLAVAAQLAWRCLRLPLVATLRRRETRSGRNRPPCHRRRPRGARCRGRARRRGSARHGLGAGGARDRDRPTGRCLSRHHRAADRQRRRRLRVPRGRVGGQGRRIDRVRSPLSPGSPRARRLCSRCSRSRCSGRDHHGVVRAARGLPPAGAGGASTDASSASVVGLVVLGQPVTVGQGSQVPVGDWGILDLATVTPKTGAGKERSAESTVVGLGRACSRSTGPRRGLRDRRRPRLRAGSGAAVRTAAPVVPSPRPAAPSAPAKPSPGAPREPGRSISGAPRRS